MQYHLVGVSLLIAAAVLETLGFGSGAVLLLGAGVACEIRFWMRRRSHS
jgi:hypothetical protein